MKRKNFLLFILILILLLTSVIPTYATNLEDKKKQLQKVQESIKKKTQELNKVKKQKSDVMQQLKKIEEQLNKTQSELIATMDKLSAVDKEAQKTAKELERAEELAKNQDELLRQRIRAMYMNGSNGYLDVLLESTSFSDFVTRAELLIRVIDYDMNLLEQMKQNRDFIAQKKQELDTQKAAILSLEQDIQKRKSDIEKTMVARQGLLRELGQKEQQYELELDELERLSAEIERTIREAQKSTSSQKYSGGRFAWPVPASTTISSSYGMRFHPIKKKNMLHSGIDISAPYGSSIIAAADGKVIYSGWFGGYGKTLIIDHGGGVATLYAHASSLLVSEGDEVKKGQTIAKVGSTGLSTGPHLHFEVRINGDPVNPMEWLK